VRLGEFLAAHPDIWVQTPAQGGRWFAAPDAARRLPAEHLDMEVTVGETAGADAGTLWIDAAGVGYRWARPLPRRPPP
jgi:hypothetical protein